LQELTKPLSQPRALGDGNWLFHAISTQENQFAVNTKWQQQ
jgi:hypothetical protein